MPDQHDPATTHYAVTVRSATAVDVPRIARTWRAAWLDGHRGEVPSELMEARDAAYFSDQSSAMVGSILLAASPDQQVAGIAIVDADELVQLAVARSARRRGVGAALLRAAEARVATEYYEAWLAVVPGNTRARGLYAKHGWHDTGDFIHQASGPAGPIPVPARRYVKTVRVEDKRSGSASGVSPTAERPLGLDADPIRL